MAGPSASDVRSILSLPTHLTAGPSQPRKPPGTSERARKPEGISRELYSLIGPSAPTLTAQFSKPRLKQKPNLGGGGRVKWEWRSFKNGARTDSLRLSHWVKAGQDPDAEYPFARYNVDSNVLVYSQEEYTRLLEDKDWSKEETDYLFTMVREYDCRFFVIADRYAFPGGPTRSMEDLKDRYYSSCRKLVRNRPWAGDEAGKAQLISSLSFDKEREIMRKKYLTLLENRTAEEVAEEESLFVELKRLEQNERRFRKERDELLRTLLGIESGLPDIQAEDDIQASLSIDTKKSFKKKGAAEPDTPVSATPSSANNVISLGPPPPKKQTAKSAAYDALHCIVRTEVPQTTATSTKAAHVPAFLRSYKLPIPKNAAAAKVAQVLGEVGVSHTRLVMPTRGTVQQLESLLEATTALVETKKQVDRIDQEIRVAKERLNSRDSEPAEGGTPAAMEADEDGDAEGEPEGEGTRSQSVVSSRSGRGRKQGRRSVSVSSVDTTGTSNKRQKRH